MSTPFHKEQSGSLFWTLKLALLEDKALILPDFAGTSRMQFRGITGTLNSHATLNLFVVHRRNNQILTVESFCVISNHMKHNSNAVHAFLGKVLNLLKHSWSTLQKCIYFSDGAALQYKNYKNFDNICYHTMCQTFNLLLSGISLLRHMEKRRHMRNCQTFGGKCKFAVSKTTYWNSWKNVSVV